MPRVPSRRLSLAIAVVAVGAAAPAGAFALSGSDSGRSSLPTAGGNRVGLSQDAIRPYTRGAVGPTGSYALGTQPIVIRLNRSGVNVESVGVTVNPWVDVPTTVDVPGNRWVLSARFQLIVRHSESGGYTDVYRTHGVVTNAASGSPGAPPVLSTWSGSLFPADWTGGCQSGVYWVTVHFILPAPYSAADFTGPAEDEFMGDASTEPFRCTEG